MDKGEKFFRNSIIAFLIFRSLQTENIWNLLAAAGVYVCVFGGYCDDRMF